MSTSLEKYTVVGDKSLVCVKCIKSVTIKCKIHIYIIATNSRTTISEGTDPMVKENVEII